MCFHIETADVDLPFFIMFNTRNLSADVDFWLTLFVVADGCEEIPLWWLSSPISTPERVFLCSFTESTLYVLAFSTMIFYSFYILTVPVFLSTSSFVQILSCNFCIILTSIINYISSCCGSIELLSQSFTAGPSLVLTLLH